MRLFIYVFTIFTLFLTTNAKAFEEDFSVNIKVDVTDENASIAQEKALASAVKAAITAATKRISDNKAVEQISSMTNNQLVNFVKETSVVNEKTSANRYMANLHLVINLTLLKTYLQEKELNISSSIRPSIVIIPVFSEFNGDSPLLWEINNPWKNAWNNVINNSSIDFSVIKDTSGNISTISAQQAWDFDTETLKKIKSLNNADDVYVLSATYKGIEGLNIDIVSLSNYRNNISIKGLKSSGEELFNQAAAEILPLIEQQTSTLILDNNSAPVNEYTVLYPFTQLTEWIAAEQKIKSMEEVVDIQVQAFSPGKVQFIVRFNVTPNDFAQVLKLSGYTLEDSGNYMILGRNRE